MSNTAQRACQCGISSGKMSHVSSEYVQEFIAGTQPGVIKSRCHDCGSVWHVLEVGDFPVDKTTFETLALTYTNLKWVDDTTR